MATKRCILPQVDQGIEVPPMSHRGGPGGVRKSMFATLEIGDSLGFVNEDEFEAIRVRAWVYAKRHPPVKFCTRHTDHGYRIWRVA